MKIHTLCVYIIFQNFLLHNNIHNNSKYIDYLFIINRINLNFNMSTNIHNLSLLENNIEQADPHSKRSSIEVISQIRETAQKQFSLGYQEPDPDQVTSERDRLVTNERYNSHRQHNQNNSNDQQSSPQRQQVDEDEHIKITIELGEGLSEDIIVPAGMENCAPELAKQFCSKHGFEEAVVMALTDKIKENIEKIKQERRNKTLSRDTDGNNMQQPGQQQQHKQHISTIKDVPQDTDSVQELSPVKDDVQAIQADASYGNLYQQPPVESYYQNKNQELYESRMQSVNQVDYRMQLLQEVEKQNQQIQMQKHNVNASDTFDDLQVPSNIHQMPSNPGSNRFKQLSRASINNLQGLQFNPQNLEHQKPVTLGVPFDMDAQQSLQQMNNSKDMSNHMRNDSLTQILPNDSSNLYKMNEHSTTSITDVDVQQNENTINNLILQTKLGNDSGFKQQNSTQQQMNPHAFSHYKGSNATAGQLNLMSTYDAQDSRIDSHYLLEAQGTGTLGTGQHISVDPDALATRNVQLKQSKSQVTKRRSRERIESRKNSNNNSDQKIIEENSQNKEGSVVGFESRLGSGGVYEEILAQSEYGYVAKKGRWKDSLTKKHDIEQIQGKQLNQRSHMSNDPSIFKSRRGNAKSSDHRTSRQQQQDLEIRSKPFVNQISQMLAKTSSKRISHESGSRPRKGSVHDRLFQQTTKGKVIGKLQELEDMRAKSKQQAKTSRNKKKKAFSKFLVSKKDSKDHQSNHQMNKQSINEGSNFDLTLPKNQSMRFENQQNSMRPKSAHHQKSQSQLIYRNHEGPHEKEGTNQQTYENQTFNIQPVSIDLHTDMSAQHLNQMKPSDKQKYQTIQILPEDKEQIEYRTPAYRENQFSTTLGGRSEVVQLQVSGIDDKNRRPRSTFRIEDRTIDQDMTSTNRNQMYSHAQHYGDEDTNPESENVSVAHEVNDLEDQFSTYQNKPNKQEQNNNQSFNTIQVVNYSNVGERLYQKGLQRNQQREQFIQEMSRLKEAKELRGATFQPITLENLHSRYVKSQNDQSFAQFTSNTFDNQQRMVIREGQPVIESNHKPKMEKHDYEHLGRRLMQYGQQLQLRKAAAKQFQDQLELDGFNFQPKICQKSVDILNHRSMQRKQQHQSQMSSQKFYGNSHLKKNEEENQASGANGGLYSQQSQNQIDQNDSPLMNLKFTPNNHKEQSTNGFAQYNSNDHYPLSENGKSPENYLISKEAQFLSPEMSIIQNENEISKVKSPPNYKSFNFQGSPTANEQFLKSQSYQNNPSMLDQNELINYELQQMSQKTFTNMSKHEALYNDAKYRSQRQRDIYSRCIDKECTFKPHMITKKSNLSKKMVKEVQEEVQDRLNLKFQGTTTNELGMITTNSLNPTQRKDAQSSRQLLKKFNDQMQTTQNDSILGAPIREVIPYNETSMSNLNDYQDLFRQKSMDRNMRINAAGLSMTESGMLGHQLSPQVSNSRIMYLNQTNPDRKFKQPVFKRLTEQAQVLQNFQKEMKEKRQKSETSRDPVTGQKYFRPIIKRHQSQGRRNQPHQVGQTLYTNYSLTQEKIKQKREEELNQLKEQRKVFARANQKSDKIIFNARRSKLGEIFDRIDNDGDGEISSNKIDIGKLPENLVRIFKPLFTELQILMQPLDKDEFVDAGMRLYDSLSQNEKNAILKFEKPSQTIDYELQKCTFTPNINLTNVPHKVNNKLNKPPMAQRSVPNTHRQTRQQRKLKKYLTKETQGGVNISIQNSFAAKSTHALDNNELQQVMAQIIKDSAMQGHFTREQEGLEVKQSQQSTPGRSLNQSNPLMSQRTMKQVEKNSSAMILNNQVTDQSLMKSVHQRLCDQQNQSKQSSQSNLPHVQSHLASVSESIQSNNQNPQIINQVMLTVPAEGPYDLPKPGSSLSIMDIGQRMTSKNDNTSVASQNSINSVPKPVHRVPSMQVQPPAIIQANVQDSAQSQGLISHVAPLSQSRQSNQFQAVNTSPFQINPQQTPMIGSSDNVTSLSQISCNTNSQPPKHHSSIGNAEISPVKELETLNLKNFNQPKMSNQSMANPYILHRGSFQNKQATQKPMTHKNSTFENEKNSFNSQQLSNLVNTNNFQN